MILGLCVIACWLGAAVLFACVSDGWPVGYTQE
jgi:hypothetical protein